MCQNPFASPAAPDYTGAANAQGAANVATAKQQGIMNNPNISGPSGGQTVSFDPTTGQPTINQNLSPQEQNIFNQNQNARLGLAGVANQGVGNVSNVMGQPFNFANYLQTGQLGSQPQAQNSQAQAAGFGNSSFQGNPPQPGAMSNPQQGAQPLPSNDPTGVPQQSINTSGVAPMPVSPGQTGQQAIMERLQPQIQTQRSQLQTQLANQGLTPGGEAYDNAMRVENQQENDMTSQAALQGIGLDFTANQQGFSQAQAQGQFGNTAQAQALQQGLQQRELPLNEVTALMSGGQVSMPAFQGYQGSQIQPPPINQAATNQGNYQAGVYNSQAQGLYGGLGLGAAAIGAGIFSDRRLKSKIRRISTHKAGLPIYKYEIFGREEIGVMADEVEKLFPMAVYNHPSGYKMVRYAYLCS